METQKLPTVSASGQGPSAGVQSAWAVPFGYRRAASPGRGTPVPDEETAGFVYDAFALVADARHSLDEVAELLAETGFTTEDGGPVPRERLLAILQHPFYAGFVREGDKLVRGRHPALVDRATFRFVQGQLAPAS